MSQKTNIPKERLEEIVENLAGYILFREFDDNIDELSELLVSELYISAEESSEIISLVNEYRIDDEVSSMPNLKIPLITKR